MKIGLMNNFVPSTKLNINMVSFMGLVNIRNGIITEDTSPNTKIYQRFIIGIKEDNWEILVTETKTRSKFIVISRNGLILNNVHLKLTTTDKEEMEYYRDLVLCGI